MPILVPLRTRKSLRRSVRSRCHAVALDQFRLIGERILDLSPRGALVACDAPVHVGDRVLLSFRAPASDAWIDTEAEVARVLEGWRAGDPGYSAGLRFTGLDRASQRELVVSLAGLPPPVPARRRPIDYAESVRRIAAA
jgi:hypothetical protein